MKIRIQCWPRDLSQLPISVEVDPEQDTVYSLKQKLEPETGTPAQSQQLILESKHLVDETLLEYYNVKKGTSIEVRRSLRSLRPRETAPRYGALSSPGLPHALDRALDEALLSVPSAASIGTKKDASNAVKAWEDLAQDLGGFDADTHIVDPRAHHAMLKSLEDVVVLESELYRQSGNYDLDTSRPLFGNKQRVSPGTSLSDLDSDSDPDSASSETALEKATKTLDTSYEMVSSVSRRLKKLREHKFSAQFFSLLVMRENDVAEIVKITRRMMDEIFECLHLAINTEDIYSEDTRPAMVPPALESFLGSMGFKFTFTSPLKVLRALVYLLDLGLVCYAGSHGSRFDLEYFQREIPSIGVNVPNEFGFTCNLRTLACLNGFLDARQVWVFDIHAGEPSEPKINEPSSSRRLSILTSITALADVWGPVWAEMTEESENESARVIKYHVSKGCIRPIARASSTVDAGIVKCHWFSWAEEHRLRFSSLLTAFSSRKQSITMGRDDKLLIGAGMTINPGCYFTLEDYEASFGELIRDAGPKPSTWRFDGMAATVQLSTPKIITLQIEGQVKKIPETTVKEYAWQKWHLSPDRANPFILNNHYGVQVSHCTGNAQRLSLKQMFLLEPVRKLLKVQFPGWSVAPWGEAFDKALRNQSKDALLAFWVDFEPQRHLARQMIAFVLDVLHDTGLTEFGLQTGLLNQGQNSLVTLETKNNDWALLLKDTHLSASYVALNEVCLECRRPDHTASICNDEKRHTVFQTEVVTDPCQAEDVLNNRFKISPHGLLVKKLDSGADSLVLPHYIAVESTLTSAFRLPRHIETVRESVGKTSNRTTSHQVILRASKTSYGGMRTPRVLVDNATSSSSSDLDGRDAPEDENSSRDLTFQSLQESEEKPDTGNTRRRFLSRQEDSPRVRNRVLRRLLEIEQQEVIDLLWNKGRR